MNKFGFITKFLGCIAILIITGIGINIYLNRNIQVLPSDFLIDNTYNIEHDGESSQGVTRYMNILR